MLWGLALQLGRLDPLPPSSCWLGVTIQESVNHFVRTKASQRPGMTSWATSSPLPLLPTKRRESQVSLHSTPLLYSCAVLLRLPCGSENQACQHIPVRVSFQTGQNSVTFHSALTFAVKCTYGSNHLDGSGFIQENVDRQYKKLNTQWWWQWWRLVDWIYVHAAAICSLVIVLKHTHIHTHTHTQQSPRMLNKLSLYNWQVIICDGPPSSGVTAGNEEFQDAVRQAVPEGQTFKGYPIQFTHRNARKAFLTCLK